MGFFPVLINVSDGVMFGFRLVDMHTMPMASIKDPTEREEILNLKVEISTSVASCVKQSEPVEIATHLLGGGW